MEAIFDRKHLVFLVRDIGELSESQRKSVNKKQRRVNAAILLSSSRLSGVVSWAGGDVTDGLTVANTSLNQFKKKKLKH